jgi:hypothetical protein
MCHRSRGTGSGDHSRTFDTPKNRVMSPAWSAGRWKQWHCFKRQHISHRLRVLPSASCCH